MTVNTTFLPKTTGLVFSDRLVARSDKGRVFLAGTTYTPLQVGTKALWLEDNVYEIGATIAGYSATFTGGSENTVYRSRAQYRKFEYDQWQNSAWFEHDNEVVSVPVVIPVAGQIRFMTQAFDDTAGVYRVLDEAKSFASIRTVPFREFGALTASVNAAPYDPINSPTTGIGTGATVDLAVNISGNAVPTYDWKVRNNFDADLTVTGNTATLVANDTGFFSVSCVITDPNTEEGDIDAMFTFISSL